MTTYEMTIRVNVDDEALAEHDGDRIAPPNDVTEWYGGDVDAALRLGFIDIEHERITVVRKENS